MAKIKKAAAVSLLGALGLETVNKWPNDRILKKLGSIDSLIEDDTELEDDGDKATLEKVIKANKKKEAIEFDDAAEKPAKAAKPEKKAAAAKKPAKDEEAEDEEEDEDEDEEEEDEEEADEEEEGEEEGEEEDSVPVHAKKKTAKKKGGKPEKKGAKKKAAAKPPKEPGMPGVRASRTRPYLAGILIKQAGHTAGITPDMVKKLNDAYGENDAESMFCLRNAWHAIRGWKTKDNEAELEEAAEAE